MSTTLSKGRSGPLVAQLEIRGHPPPCWRCTGEGAVCAIQLAASLAATAGGRRGGCPGNEPAQGSQMGGSGRRAAG